MTGNDYTCEMCNETFERTTTEEVAQAEAKRNFGEDFFEREPDTAIVCDDCYQELKKVYPWLE